jgi:hypothetical protein
MKKIAIVLLGLALVACSRKVKEKIKDQIQDRIEITPFIVTKLILKDTTQLKTIYAQTDSGRISMSDYKEYVDDLPMYLDKNQFRNFEAAMWEIVRDPKAKVFMNDKPVTKDQIRNRFFLCDSIMEVSYDAKGNETIKASFACDSTSVVHHINMIRFAESWFFNKNSNMIEREILGYSVFEWVPEKMGFKSVFEVYPNEDSHKKAKRYDFW